MGAYDFKNKKFGKLTAIKIAKKDDSGHNYWQCTCECGNTLVVRATNLINGSVTMCKDCKKNINKKVIYKDDIIKTNNLNNNVEDIESFNKDYDNITIIKDSDILYVPVIFSVVHAINSDLTYASVTKDKQTLEYRDALAGKFDKFFKIREQLDEFSVCEWEVGDVIYTAPVYSLLTKNDRYDKVTYKNVEKCLLNLKRQALDNETFYLAFPKICCGKDGLDWTYVKLLIKKVFGDSEFEIMLFE